MIPFVGPLIGIGANALSGLFGGASGPLSGVLGPLIGIAVGGFEAIIKVLFAPIAKFITTEVIGWLITIPNLTGGNVAQLEQTVAGMAIGAAAAVSTFAIIRYWLTGLIGGGGSGLAGLEGLAQMVFAILLIAIWPWLFGTLAHLTNAFTGSLLATRAVVGQSAQLIGSGLALSAAGAAISGPFGLFVMIVLAVVASLLFLGLLFMKIIVASSTLLIFVGMPLAAVLWPASPWVGRMAARALGVCLFVPVAWAVCFATAGAVGANALTQGAGSALNTLLQPLVAIALLWITIKLPVHLARVAMLGAAPLGGGFISRAASYAAGSQVREAIRTHLPATAGGRGPAADSARQAGESRTGQRLRDAATLAAATATGGATAAAGAGGTAAGAGSAARSGAGANGAGLAGAPGSAGGKAGVNARAYTPPPSAQQTAGKLPAGGLQAPSFAGREQDFANEKFEAEYRARTNPVSTAQARDALAALPEATQRGVAQLAGEHGEHAREHLAYQALGEWSPQEREALRTLAAASPETRAQATSARAGASTGGAADGGIAAAGVAGAAGEAVTNGAVNGSINGHGHPAGSTPDGPGSPIEPAGATGSTIEHASLAEPDGDSGPDHGSAGPAVFEPGGDSGSGHGSVGAAVFDAPGSDQPAAGWGDVIDPDEVMPPPPPPASDVARPGDDVIELGRDDVIDLGPDENDGFPPALPATGQAPAPPIPPQPRETPQPRDVPDPARVRTGSAPVDDRGGAS